MQHLATQVELSEHNTLPKDSAGEYGHAQQLAELGRSGCRKHLRVF